MALPLGFTVSGSAQMRWTDYKGDWVPFTRDGSPCEDRTRSLRLSAHNRAFNLLGFSPELSIVRETRTCSAQLCDYGRTRGELRFVQQFQEAVPEALIHDLSAPVIVGTELFIPAELAAECDP